MSTHRTSRSIAACTQDCAYPTDPTEILILCARTWRLPFYSDQDPQRQVSSRGTRSQSESFMNVRGRFRCCAYRLPAAINSAIRVSCTKKKTNQKNKTKAHGERRMGVAARRSSSCRRLRREPPTVAPHLAVGQQVVSPRRRDARRSRALRSTTALSLSTRHRCREVAQRPRQIGARFSAKAGSAPSSHPPTRTPRVGSSC